MNFNMNDLMDAVNIRFFDSFCHTLDVRDYVPERYLVKTEQFIFKCMRKAWKKIARENRRYQKEQAKLCKLEKRKLEKRKVGCKSK